MSSVRTRAEWSQMARRLYRYGMLVFISGLLAWRVYRHIRLPPSYSGDPYSGYFGIVMLILLYLVGAFKWRRRVAVVLAILALGWGFVMFVYLVCLSRVLYPLPELPLSP